MHWGVNPRGGMWEPLFCLSPPWHSLRTPIIHFPTPEPLNYWPRNSALWRSKGPLDLPWLDQCLDQLLTQETAWSSAQNKANITAVITCSCQSPHHLHSMLTVLGTTMVKFHHSPQLPPPPFPLSHTTTLTCITCTKCYKSIQKEEGGRGGGVEG